MKPFISFQNVTKAFGDKAVLQGLSLDIAQGESFVLLGRSGIGKSVTLKCLLGLLRPDSGSIALEGRSLLDQSKGTRQALMARVGMLFQGAALFDSLPIWRNVGFRLLEQGQNAASVRQTAIELLAQVGLNPDVATQMPADLSGGMRKRAGLARALAGEPDILLFDEPTTGLDPISGAQIDELIASLRSARGATSITITHDLASARRIADRVGLLHAGRLVWQGTPNELDSSADPHLRQFVDALPQGPLTTGPKIHADARGGV